MKFILFFTAVSAFALMNRAYSPHGRLEQQIKLVNWPIYTRWTVDDVAKFYQPIFNLIGEQSDDRELYLKESFTSFCVMASYTTFRKWSDSLALNHCQIILWSIQHTLLRLSTFCSKSALLLYKHTFPWQNGQPDISDLASLASPTTMHKWCLLTINFIHSNI